MKSSYEVRVTDYNDKGQTVNHGSLFFDTEDESWKYYEAMCDNCDDATVRNCVVQNFGPEMPGEYRNLLRYMSYFPRG